MRMLRRDKENMVPLEVIAKCLYGDSQELDEMKVLLEEFIMNSKSINKKQWVRLRNCIYCELFTTN